MKFFVTATALVSLVPAVLGLTINTPANVVQCQPVLLTWGDGTPPYYLTLIPAGQVSAAPIKTFPTQTGTQLTWTVDLQANSNFNVALKDSTGATAYTDIVTVQSSSDNSCLNSTSSDVTVPSGATSPTNTATGTNSSPTSGTKSGGSGGSSTKTSGTSTPSSGSNSGSSGGAIGLALSSFGVAGVVGAFAVLL